MDGPRALDLDGTAGNVAGGNVTNHGADPAQLIAMLNNVLAYQYTDEQRRRDRQTQVDEDARRIAEEHRRERDAAGLQWAMMRQRFDVMATRLDRLDTTNQQFITEAVTIRWWIIALTVTLFVLSAIFAAHYYGVLAIAIQTGSAAVAIGGLIYRHSRGH
ncbi:MAG: hypothetical protein WCG26_03010 [Chloroflexales bacterium]